MTAEDVFRRVIPLLDSAGIPYMLTGSFASAFHGVPRATQDIDLVIAPGPEQLHTFIRDLPPRAYYVDEAAALDAEQTEGQFNVIDLDAGWKIDLIIRKGRPFSQEEFNRRQPADVWGLSLSVATLEDVILAKLEWAKLGESDRQIEDVAALLRLRESDLDRAYISRWMSDLGVESQWRRAAERAGLAA